MSGARSMTGLLLAAAVTLLLGGCVYDHLQRTDRVAFSAGDAVKANLAVQTIDPSRGSMYKTKGLGRNGSVIATPAAEAPAE